MERVNIQNCPRCNLPHFGLKPICLAGVAWRKEGKSFDHIVMCPQRDQPVLVHVPSDFVEAR